MSALTSFSMFFLSFMPLWISVIFLDVKSILDGSSQVVTEIVSIAMIAVVTLISLIWLYIFANQKDQREAKGYVLTSAKEEKTATSEFMLSYMLPLFAFDFTLWHETVLFLLFFGIFAILCIRHSHFSVNIVLELLGYRYYSCTLLDAEQNKLEKGVISRDPLTAKINEDITTRYINNEYELQIKTK